MNLQQLENKIESIEREIDSLQTVFHEIGLKIYNLERTQKNDSSALWKTISEHGVEPLFKSADTIQMNVLHSPKDLNI